jgi:hypothetical protein
VRDDRPFAGSDPPAAAFLYSADRGGVHPEAHLATYAGLMQADAYEHDPDEIHVELCSWPPDRPNKMSERARESLIAKRLRGRSFPNSGSCARRTPAC